MRRCINIDWLELYCLEPRFDQPLDANFFESVGWNVHRREYGTRVYGEMFTLYDVHDVPMIEVRRKPLSSNAHNGGLFDERSCHIRLTNVYCYADSPIDIMREFLTRYDYILVRIFRIDIALDFTQFDKGDEPSKFISRYMNGRYSKVNQTNITAHGVDEWNGQTWQSLAWGKPKSMISTKMYCKTIELEQAKDKPYIRHAWWLAGLIDNPISCTRKDENGKTYKPAVWRVEFSIKSSAKKWFLIERADTRKANNIAQPHTLDMYENKEKLEHVFASLAQHYFRFKIYEEGVRKDRCKDKVLFEFKYFDTYYKVDRQASHRPSTKKIDRLINAITEYKDSTIDSQVIKACQVIVDSLRRLQVREYAGHTMSDSDILELQLLMGCKDRTLVKSMIQEFAGAIF